MLKVRWIEVVDFDCNNFELGDSELESCLGLFSISEEFFGDRCKRSLIYRALTAKNMRPQKVTWLGRKGDLVRFFDLFCSNHHIEKSFLKIPNSYMIFLKGYHIGFKKNSTRRYARVRYYAGNDLKVTSLISNLLSTTPNDLLWQK